MIDWERRLAYYESACKDRLCKSQVIELDKAHMLDLIDRIRQLESDANAAPEFMEGAVFK